MQKRYYVSADDLSPEQALKYILKTLQQMETNMANYGASITALQGAIDGVAQRLLPQIQTLKDQLASALEDDAAVAEAFAALDAEIDRLNALGTDPTSPVDPESPNVDEVPEVVVPADPDVQPEEPTDVVVEEEPVEEPVVDGEPMVNPDA